MRPRNPDDPLDHLVDDELAAAFEAAAAEHRAALFHTLIELLDRVRLRGAPVRGVGRFRGQAARLRFADGTAVLATGGARGDLAMVAMAVARQRPVLLTDVFDAGSDVHAVLQWDDHRAEIIVLGRDQPE